MDIPIEVKTRIRKERRKRIIEIMSKYEAFRERVGKHGDGWSVYERTKNCGYFYNEYIHKEDNPECEKHYHLFKFRCETLLCESCQEKKLYKVRNEIKDILIRAYDERKTGHEISKVIFTQKTPRSERDKRGLLPHRYKKIRKDFLKLWRRTWGRKIYEKGKLKRNFNKLNGAVYKIEIGKDFNVHIHMLVLGEYWPLETERYEYGENKGKIKKKGLVPLWYEITGDSWNVHISGFKELTDNFEVKEGALYGAIAETVKYTIKDFKDITEEKLIEYYLTLKGRRNYSKLGKLYNYKILIEKIDFVCTCCQKELLLNRQGIHFSDLNKYAPDETIINDLPDT